MTDLRRRRFSRVCHSCRRITIAIVICVRARKVTSLTHFTASECRLGEREITSGRLPFCEKCAMVSETRAHSAICAADVGSYTREMTS